MGSDNAFQPTLFRAFAGPGLTDSREKALEHDYPPGAKIG